MNEKLQESVSELAAAITKSIEYKPKARVDNWDKAKVIANWVAAIAVPFVLGLAGYYVNLTLKSQESQAKLTALAIEILKEVPDKSEDTTEIRKWAISVVNKYSDVKITGSAKAALVERRPLVVDDKKYKTIDELTTLEAARYRTSISSVGLFGRTFSFCTAWMIGDDRILTAANCVAPPVSNNWGFRLGYHTRSNLGSVHRIKEIVVTSSKKNFSVLRLQKRLQLKSRLLELKTREPVPGENVFMVHHPGGDPIRVSDKDCVVVDSKKPGTNVFIFRCGTASGSAGAPIVAVSDGQVLGMHVGIEDKKKSTKNAVRIVDILKELESTK